MSPATPNTTASELRRKQYQARRRAQLQQRLGLVSAAAKKLGATGQRNRGVNKNTLDELGQMAKITGLGAGLAAKSLDTDDELADLTTQGAGRQAKMLRSWGRRAFSRREPPNRTFQRPGRESQLNPILAPETARSEAREEEGPAETAAEKTGTDFRDIVSRQNTARNEIKKNMGAVAQDATAIAEMGVNEGSKLLLTSFWGSVWLDWTLFSLLYLNGHLVASIFLPRRVCQFGEDYLIGKWIPGKELAKYTEILILAVIDVFVLTILALLAYILYSIAYAILNPFETGWDLLWGGHWSLLWNMIRYLVGG